MPPVRLPETVEYLVIGHLACDRTPHGSQLGGTAAYAALTAQAFGLRVGIVTAWGGELPLHPLETIALHIKHADQSTIFENITTPHGRIQYLHHRAPILTLEDVPASWRTAPIIHLGPIAQEVHISPNESLQAEFIGLTPQGWLRAWDASGRVRPCDWPDAQRLLSRASAAVISLEDVDGDESRAREMAAWCPLLVVTAGAAGACLYWHGSEYRFEAPRQIEVDSTGAGDIFAAAFFCLLHRAHDPLQAARLATHLAALSVTRPALAGIPTIAEIEACLEVS